MSTIPSIFSDAFQNERMDVVTGTVVAAALPNVPAKLARFRARATNTGPIYLGVSSLTSWSLPAGIETDWIGVPTGNLNHYYQSCPSGTVNRLEYWVQW